jgi:VanZ family protein
VTRSVGLHCGLRAVWFFAILIIIVGSLLPSTSFLVRALDHLQINDKVLHFAAYMTLAFLPAMHERRTFVIVTAVGAAALGVALEFGQLVSGWRDFEIGDMIAGALGVCVGVVVGIAMRRMDVVRAVLPGIDE